MLITKVEIRPLEKPLKSFYHEGDMVVAYCTIEFDSVFVIHNIKIVEGYDNRLYVQMCKRKMKSGKSNDMFHPIDQNFRQYMKECIIDAYLNRN